MKFPQKAIDRFNAKINKSSNCHEWNASKQKQGYGMFSYDGKKLVFSSNRNNGGTRATNLFIADWKE